MALFNFNHYPQFFTATILKWKHLLNQDEYEQIKRMIMPAFVVGHKTNGVSLGF